MTSYGSDNGELYLTIAFWAFVLGHAALIVWLPVIVVLLGRAVDELRRIRSISD